MNKSWRRSFALSPDTRSSLAALSLLAGSFAVVVALLYYLATADDRISPLVVATEDGGRLQSARFIDRATRRETEIETEKGVFLVRGVFPALKGHPLVLERRGDGAWMLCDRAQKICGRLVQ